jgi:predicted nuclease of predicted toxin-antitoxin system
VKFLGDENLDWQIVERLRLDGHEVLYVVEMEPGIPDDEVLELANNQGAILLTSDKDFGELVFRLRRIATGIVLIRLFGLSPDDRAEIIANTISLHADELLGAFTVISSKNIRIRKIT